MNVRTRIRANGWRQELAGIVATALMDEAGQTYGVATTERVTELMEITEGGD